MTESNSAATKRNWLDGPLAQLIVARIKEFYREPEALFWVYGFPIVMTVALGSAFREKPIEKLKIDVLKSDDGARAFDLLKPSPRFDLNLVDETEARLRLRTGKTDLVVAAQKTDGAAGALSAEYRFDPTKPGNLFARDAVDDALQRALGRKDLAATRDVEFKEEGGRYIDFLVPGLLGMSLMGGGLWGVGFVVVDMRIRKLLKRFLATPMKRSTFLAAIMASRLVFLIPEVGIILLFGRYAFGVRNHGSAAAVAVLTILGAFAFAGLGLLVASRAKTIETVSGLMNLVMLPMWILSGIFFSSDRFPDVMQPLIKALPLTALNDSLRAVMQEGASLASQAPQMALLGLGGAACFALALKIFRWI